MVGRLVVASLVAFCLCITAGASAQEAAPTADDVKKAATAFDRGRQAYRNEEFVEAAEHFETADGHAPSAAALKLAIASRYDAGQLARAATLAVLAKERSPDEVELIELADQVLSETGSLYEVRVFCDEPCELVVDNKLVHGRPATERVLYLNPGSASIRASWGADRAETKQTEGEAGARNEVSFIAPDVVSAIDAEPESDDTDEWYHEEDEAKDTGVEEGKGGWSPTVFWVGLGLTAVAGGVTVWSGVDTQNNPGTQAVIDNCGNQDEECPQYQDGLARQNRTNALIGVTAGLGVATLIVGAFLTDWSGGGDDTQASRTKHHERQVQARGWAVQPWVSVGDGAAIGASGRF